MPSDPDSDGDDLESFHRWLSSTAAAEGISEAQLVDEMLSYYWIVNELSKTVGEPSDASGIASAPGDVSLDNLHVDPDAGNAAPEGPRANAPPEEGSANDAAASPESSPEEGSSGDPVEEFLENVDQIERLVESLQRLRTGLGSNDVSADGDRGQSPAAAGEDAATPTSGSDVAEAFVEVEDRLEALRIRQEVAFQTVHAAVSGLEHRQEQIATQAADEDDLSEVAAVQDEILEELTGLGDQLEALDGRHEALEDSQEALEDSHVALEDSQETLEASHERLSERIEAEFDDLESILTHLLETVSGLHTEIDDVTRSQEGDLEMLKYQLEKRHHLQELKREANLQGVERADCSNCGQTVRLGLLETPFCPECGEQFARIESTWLPFTNATLENGGPLKR